MKNKKTFQIAAAAALALAIAAVAAGPEATGGSRGWAAKVAAPKAAPTPTVTVPDSPNGEQLAFCKKHGVLVENCANVYELVQSGQPVEGINYFDNDERESYEEYLAKQNQRKADLEYCAKNRTDWSCAEGQYKGQY